MISFFRRALSSKIVLALLALIALAFIVTSFEQPFGGSGASGSGGAVATVGGKAITEAEMVKRINNQVDALRREQPGLDMAAFIAGGGVEQAIEQTINGRAIEIFANDQGMIASKRLVDGEIASIPAFAGPTGKFDQSTFQSLLAQRRINETELRGDFAREALSKALLVPAAGAPRLPATLVRPYAALLLEKRAGQIAIIPSGAFVDARAPTDAQVQSFYRANTRRYTVPEQRVVRYATFDGTRFADVTATDAEIKAAYDRGSAQYAGKEQRRFTQVIVADEAQARRVLALAGGGGSFDAAARAVGRSTIAVPATDRAGFTALTSAAVAGAAFATPQGSFAPLQRSGVGFHVVRVDAITNTAATPLAAVSTKLAADIVEAKRSRAIADLVAEIEDGTTGGSTFDELVAKHRLTAQTTPPVTAQGMAPGAAPGSPEATLDAALAPVLRDAFQADDGDDPSVIALEPGKRFALFKLDRVIAAAPRPLAAMRDQVVADLRLDGGARAARTAADAVVALVNRGMPLTEALGRAGRPLPPPQTVDASRLQLAQAQGEIPPPIAMMFGLPENVRERCAPRGQGWYVVYLSRIESGDISGRPELVAAAQNQLGRAAGPEYAAQLARAIRDRVGARRDDAAIARLKEVLMGRGGAAR